MDHLQITPLVLTPLITSSQVDDYAEDNGNDVQIDCVKSGSWALFVLQSVFVRRYEGFYETMSSNGKRVTLAFTFPVKHLTKHSKGFNEEL